LPELPSKSNGGGGGVPPPREEQYAIVSLKGHSNFLDPIWYEKLYLFTRWISILFCLRFFSRFLDPLQKSTRALSG